LREEFLAPLGMTAYQLAKGLGIEQTRVSQILHGRRAITPDTALRLSRFFGVSPQFWLNIQARYDIEERRREMAAELEAITPYEAVCA